MSELHERLDRALRAIDVGPAPVDEAIRRGKGIRARRRAAVIAGVAAVAVAVSGYPALSGLRVLPAASPQVVTDVPPGPGSPPGLIAAGKIGDRTWRAIVEKARPGRVPANELNYLCVTGWGTVFEPVGYSSTGCEPPTPPVGGDPVAFDWMATKTAAGMIQFQYGAVASDVTYVLIRLSDGQELKLVPVKRYGLRMVAFVAPVPPQIVSAIAYLSNGQHQTATLVNNTAGLTIIEGWLRPGGHG